MTKSRLPDLKNGSVSFPLEQIVLERQWMCTLSSKEELTELTELSTLFAIEFTEMVISTYSMVTYVCAKQNAMV